MPSKCSYAGLRKWGEKFPYLLLSKFNPNSLWDVTTVRNIRGSLGRSDNNPDPYGLKCGRPINNDKF